MVIIYMIRSTRVRLSSMVDTRVVESLCFSLIFSVNLEQFGRWPISIDFRWFVSQPIRRPSWSARTNKRAYISAWSGEEKPLNMAQGTTDGQVIYPIYFRFLLFMSRQRTKEMFSDSQCQYFVQLIILKMRTVSWRWLVERIVFSRWKST